MSKESEREEQERRRRENDRQADASGDAIASALLSFFKSILPQWLYEFIFEEDPNAPNESAEDMAPVSAGEKIRQARTTIDSRAAPKWDALKSEYTGGTVQHSSPIPKHAVVTSGKGPRTVSVGSRNHEGIDIDVTQGDTSPILASAEGIVLFSGRKGGYGNTVIIGHADGTRTLYAHMTGSNMPQVGEHLDRGEVIGQMGNTGLKGMKVHLHYEQWNADGVKITPVINGQRMAKHDSLHAGHQHAGTDHDHDDEVIAATPKGVAKPKPSLAAADHKLPSSVRLAATKAVAPKKNDDEPAKEKSLLADGFQFKDIKEGASTVFANATSAIGNVLGNLTVRG